MIPTSLSSEYKTRVNIRPVKRAYFVRENDHDALIRVIRYLCTEWGGIRNIIIPVGPDFSIPPLFRGQLLYHEPDQFVFFGETSEIADHRKHWSDTQELRDMFPWRDVTVEFEDIFLRYDQAMHPLGVIPKR